MSDTGEELDERPIEIIDQTDRPDLILVDGELFQAAQQQGLVFQPDGVVAGREFAAHRAG